MEIGSLADWFTGIATFSAVLMTLFFTFYQQHVGTKKLRRNTIKSILKLSENLFKVVETGNYSPQEVYSLQEYKIFSIYLNVMTFTSADNVEGLVDIGEEMLIDLIGMCHSKEDREKELKEYMSLKRKLVNFKV